jgi:hypothetical protein
MDSFPVHPTTMLRAGDAQLPGRAHAGGLTHNLLGSPGAWRWGSHSRTQSLNRGGVVHGGQVPPSIQDALLKGYPYAGTVVVTSMGTRYYCRRRAVRRPPSFPPPTLHAGLL